MAIVYWITDDLNKSPVDYGYVGFTSRTLKLRLYAHKRDYKKFCKGGYTGCKKLYKKIKSLGGFDKVRVIVLFESSTEYGLMMEQKLRFKPNIGWNIRVGGDTPLMLGRETSPETKLKLAEVRKTWVMSPESRNKLSLERKGSGNPMFNTKPWENPASTISSRLTWYHADDIFAVWLETNSGPAALFRTFPNLNPNSIVSMLKKFKLGWNPRQDISWTTYKENYD